MNAVATRPHPPGHCGICGDRTHVRFRLARKGVLSWLADALSTDYGWRWACAAHLPVTV
jgi:hypothetical protein